MMSQTQLTSSAKETCRSRRILRQEWTLKCRQVQLITKAWWIKPASKMLTVLLIKHLKSIWKVIICKPVYSDLMLLTIIQEFRLIQNIQGRKHLFENKNKIKLRNWRICTKKTGRSPPFIKKQWGMRLSSVI
jgi:hypothetical protein